MRTAVRKELFSKIAPRPNRAAKAAFANFAGDRRATGFLARDCLVWIGRRTDVASVLTDLGLPRGALALAGFNFGVEAGQIALGAQFLPLAFALRLSVFYRRIVVVGGSSALEAISALRFVERVFDVKFLPVH